MQTVLCADIGTSSLKAALIAADGKVLGYARVQFILHGTRHAAAEWLKSLCTATGQMYAAGNALPSPDALCISGNGPTLVSTATEETLLWSEELSPQTKEFIAGLSHSAQKSLFLPRIVEFRNRYGRHSVLSGPEFLIWKLTGALLTILPQERFTAAYWTSETLYEAGFKKADLELFAGFVAPAHLAGHLSPGAAELLGAKSIRPGTPVYCGAPDFVSALAGTATLFPGTLCDRAGSSEGLNLCTGEPLEAPGIRTLPSVIPGLWNASVLLPRSGSRFSDFAQKVQRETGMAVDLGSLVSRLVCAKATHSTASAPQEAAVRAPEAPAAPESAAHSTASAPQEAPARAPEAAPPHRTDLASHSTPAAPEAADSTTYAKLCPQTIKEGLALMEQTAQNVKNGIQALKEAAARQNQSFPSQMTVTGGQASNAAWNQFKANVTGLSINVPSCPDAELMGDAAFAFTGMGLYPTLQKAAQTLMRPARTFTPQKGKA